MPIIKHKNADVISAFVNGKIIQGRNLELVNSTNWNDIWLSNGIGHIKRSDNIELFFVTILFNPESWEFRIKHPYQDLIDQYQKSSSLSIFKKVFNPIDDNDWVFEVASLEELKLDVEGKSEWCLKDNKEYSVQDE